MKMHVTGVIYKGPQLQRKMTFTVITINTCRLL